GEGLVEQDGLHRCRSLGEEPGQGARGREAFQGVEAQAAHRRLRGRILPEPDPPQPAASAQASWPPSSTVTTSLGKRGGQPSSLLAPPSETRWTLGWLGA